MHRAHLNDVTYRIASRQHAAANLKWKQTVTSDGATPATQGPATQGQKTPLHFACCRGDPKEIIAALQTGVNVNSQDDKMCTPLHIAARFNHTEVCRFLMSQGADPAIKDAAGRTPPQVTKSPEVKAFFAEASQNPAVYTPNMAPGGSNNMSAGAAPFVDAGLEDTGLEL